VSNSTLQPTWCSLRTVAPRSYATPATRSGSSRGIRTGAGAGAAPGIRAAGRDRAAAVLDQQARRPFGGHRRQLRVDDPLEAPRRLAGQLVPARGPRDDGRVEVGRLQDDIDGAALARLADLGGRAAHDPGQADRPGVVDDEQVVGIQPALDVVEGGQGLPGRSAAHPDAAGEAEPRRRRAAAGRARA
jgi:hypothetical protein